jgi:hypothetical protein
VCQTLGLKFGLVKMNKSSLFLKNQIIFQPGTKIPIFIFFIYVCL